MKKEFAQYLNANLHYVINLAVLIFQYIMKTALDLLKVFWDRTLFVWCCQNILGMCFYKYYCAKLPKMNCK